MENAMKKYKVIALSALIAAGFTSCDLTEKPTSYYEKALILKLWTRQKCQ